jgi:hypothetical protein
MEHLDLSFLGRRDFTMKPISIRNFNKIQTAPGPRFWRGIYIWIPLGLLLWGLIIGIFIYAGPTR